MNEGPIYNGYTRDSKTMTLHLPIQMPGFGKIESEEGWMLFYAWMKEEMEAHQRTLEALRQATTQDDTDDDYTVRLHQYVLETQP